MKNLDQADYMAAIEAIQIELSGLEATLVGFGQVKPDRPQCPGDDLLFSLDLLEGHRSVLTTAVSLAKRKPISEPSPVPSTGRDPGVAGSSAGAGAAPDLSKNAKGAAPSPARVSNSVPMLDQSSERAEFAGHCARATAYRGALTALGVSIPDRLSAVQFTATNAGESAGAMGMLADALKRLCQEHGVDVAALTSNAKAAIVQPDRGAGAGKLSGTSTARLLAKAGVSSLEELAAKKQRERNEKRVR